MIGRNKKRWPLKHFSKRKKLWIQSKNFNKNYKIRVMWVRDNKAHRYKSKVVTPVFL